MRTEARAASALAAILRMAIDYARLHRSKQLAHKHVLTEDNSSILLESMPVSLYSYLSGASGLAMIALGLGYIVEPAEREPKLSFGSFYIAAGLLFALDSFSNIVYLPFALENFIRNGSIFVLGQSLFKLYLVLFVKETDRGSYKRVFIVGAVFCALFWILSGLDGILSLDVIATSVNEGSRVGPLLFISSIAIYIWPLSTAAISFRLVQKVHADPARSHKAMRAYSVALGAFATTLVAIIIASAFSISALYTAAQIVLQLLILAWYFHARMHPESLSRFWEEAGNRRSKKFEMDPEEARAIGERLNRLVTEKEVFKDSSLDLPKLAKILGIPSYRLSTYFNMVLGLRFPEWLNGLRVNYVRSLLDKGDSRNILDMASEAGYSSKAVFNSQFLRIVGVKPSTYRLDAFSRKNVSNS